MIDVICWKWEPLPNYRSKFEAKHVNTLYSTVSRNTTLPLRFSCITDDPTGISDEIRIIELWQDFKDVQNPNKKLSPSCYRRLKAFSKEAKDLIGDRIFSLDLDVVITGNIDHLLNRPEDFVCMRGTARNTYYNGGMWLLKAGSRTEVWNTFDPENSPKMTRKNGIIGSDQGWISYVLGPQEAIYTKEDGVYCYITDMLKRHKGKTKKLPLPENAKIVLFNGKVDPWEVDYEWVKEHYV